MSAARLDPVLDADFEEVGDQRRADRRRDDRRAQRQRLETLFAATLVNHVLAPEKARSGAYTAPQSRLKPGIVLNLSA